MHELSVTQSILNIVVQHAQQANAKRVEDIQIVMGELSTNVDDSIQFYWPLIANGTLAENATLHFRRVPTQMQCLGCNHLYHPQPDELDCPHCGYAGSKIVAGEEFYVESIDIE
jgi:hydrogenase nickel incorporation protein HypA/HybF